jgi:hypothetical protein
MSYPPLHPAPQTNVATLPTKAASKEYGMNKPVPFNGD